MVADMQKSQTFLYASSLMRQDIAFEWIRKIQDVVNGVAPLGQALGELQALQDKPQ